VLEAATRNSDPKKVELKLAYRPPLPALELAAVPSSHNEDKERPGSAEVALKAFINPQTDFHPFDVLIRVINSKAAGGKADPVIKEFTKAVADDDAVDLGRSASAGRQSRRGFRSQCVVFGEPGGGANHRLPSPSVHPRPEGVGPWRAAVHDRHGRG
jgi:hypothetical protein